MYPRPPYQENNAPQDLRGLPTVPPATGARPIPPPRIGAPGYDYTYLMTYGGAAGTYNVPCPWNSNAELCVIAFAFSTQGAAYLVDAKGDAVPPVASTLATNDGGVRGVLVIGQANVTIPVTDIFVPVRENMKLVTTSTAFMTAVWRRALDHVRQFQPDVQVHPDQEEQYHQEREEAFRERLERGY